MEHVEEAGVHSGDSACVTPPPTLSEEASKQIMSAVEELALALEVRGLINIQFAVKGNEAFVLEANPRFTHRAFHLQSVGYPAGEGRGEGVLDGSHSRTTAD